ncbi:uncharacterized protein Z519_06331 [Cladophialophora bantiana CBS 173.52]|uniref:RNase III domain-containing protein n=1 Tax=Cladophialophora bantiana (strain ATCC 10958 / CBS 173.52 / CDC B-1940 / NIH 8579) TaxID=1442370 RepID=A0A0D2I6N2_CLAB1|nr:uncharacterized protein Z519_06331 [Cladophialophora bantiana CBS 173.52]KIW92484.1 hypothetical protein Z519_06331 [Cladophialophora bantiana CBS 173.52]
MSARTSSSGRIISDLLRTSRASPSCDHLRFRQAFCKTPRQSRHVSTAAPQLSEMEVDADRPPRWSQTPPALKAPVRVRPPRIQTPLKINKDQRKLDDFYVRFLGRDGDKMLSEETKWLAVTNKSFDAGRRGFNDRLAFFGKRILELQCSLGLISVADASRYPKSKELDPYGRQPFGHPATESVECLLGGAHHWFTSHKQLSTLAEQYGLPEVVRWHPRDPDRLQASGSELVYSQAILAIIGALALEQGGAVANQIAKEKVLVPLGLKLNWKPKAELAQPSQPQR